MPEAPRIKHIEDIPPLPAAGVGYRLVRRELGIRAFGTNAFTADAGVQLIEEHDETGSGAGGHEELYVVIAGHARFSIDGIEHDAPAGTLGLHPGSHVAAHRDRAGRRHDRAGSRRRARSRRTRCRRGSRRSPRRASPTPATRALRPT